MSHPVELLQLHSTLNWLSLSLCVLIRAAATCVVFITVAPPPTHSLRTALNATKRTSVTNELRRIIRNLKRRGGGPMIYQVGSVSTSMSDLAELKSLVHWLAGYILAVFMIVLIGMLNMLHSFQYNDLPI